MALKTAFISSVMVGYQPYRDAASTAVRDLGLTALVIDDLPSTPDSPRAACLQLVAEADLYVLLTGDRYGFPLPPSDISATHQEFREAQRLRKPILVFVHEGLDADERLWGLRREAEDWSAGSLRSLYTTPDELRSAITSALHRLLQDHARGAPDNADLAGHAASLIEEPASARRQVQRNSLLVAFAPGPRQTVVRPSEVEGRADELGLALINNRIVNLADGCRTDTTPQSLKLFNDSLSLTMSSLGDIVFEGSLESPHRADAFANHLGAVVEEDVREGLELGFRAASTLLELVDSTRSLSWCGIASTIRSRDYASWTNRARIAMSPGTMRVSMNQRPDSPVMLEVQQRTGLTADADRLIDDLIVLLRATFV